MEEGLKIMAQEEERARQQAAEEARLQKLRDEETARREAEEAALKVKLKKKNVRASKQQKKQDYKN